MKNFLKEYVKIIVSILSILLFSLAFHNIYINMLHQKHIDQKILVTNLDKNYVSYNENIEKIQNNLNNYNYHKTKYPYDMQTMEKLRSKLNLCLTSLKKEEGLSGVKVNERIEPFRLYSINSNFLNELVNQCWVSSLGFVFLGDNDYKGYFNNAFPLYNDIVNELINNTNYVKKGLLNNSSYHYSTAISRDTLYNEYLSQYNSVVNNYNVFSNIIVDISEFLAKGENSLD